MIRKIDGVSMIADMNMRTMEKNSRSAGVVALELLVQRLVNGEFTMGQSIRETRLARETGVSRNAIREALNQIVGWGIFEYVPYCGYRMREFSLSDFLEWHEMREAIEPLAARRLARLRPPLVIQKLEQCLYEFDMAVVADDIDGMRRADFNFHLTVVENCGNRNFSHMRNTIYMVILFFCYTTFHSKLRYTVENSTNKLLPKHFSPQEFEVLNTDLTKKMHRKMLKYIKNGDAEAAESCFKTHAANQVHNMENIIMYCNQ